MDRPMKFGLIGAGRQGREHLVASTAASIVAAVDGDRATAEALHADHPDVRVHGTVAEMAAAEQLDGLVVAVPHHVAPEIWRDLLSTGLPMLKEKPLARSLSEALELLAEAENAGVPVVTAVQRRNHPSYQHLAECLVGQRVHAVSATLHLGFDPNELPTGWRGDPVQAGGGALLDSGYHMVDLVQMLVGAVEVVSATLWTPEGPAGPRDIDNAAVVNGRAGSCWVRIESRVGGERRSDGGWQKFEEVIVDAEHGRFRADRTGVWRDGQPVFTCDRGWSAGMASQLEQFAGMVRSGRFDTPVVWDQVAAMRVVEKSYAALRRVFVADRQEDRTNDRRS